MVRRRKFVQKIDELLFENAKGKVGQPLEKAIAQLPTPSNVSKAIWGESLFVQSFLLEEERANTYMEKLIKSYWGELHLLLIPYFEQLHLDVHHLNSRLEQYLKSEQGMQRLIQYVKRNQRLNYQQFLSLVFEKDIQVEAAHTGLAEIICLTLKDKYLVQGIYTEYQSFWQTIFAKKMYSILVQGKLDTITNPLQFFRIFKSMLSAECTSNRAATIIHKLIHELDYQNPKSFELKQLHIYNMLNHYLSGKRSLVRLEKCIEQFTANWKSGNFGMTEKEQTLIHYLLFMRAVQLKKPTEVLYYTHLLLEEDRLSTYSVEIFLEFGDILKLVQPNEHALLKFYPAYYLEHVYSLMLHTYVENEQYEAALHLLKHQELASCAAIYESLNNERISAPLAQIEATIQRDIVRIMHMQPNEMMRAIKMWRDAYLNEPDLLRIAKSSAKHVQTILKVLFVTEQFDAFEKLMDVYKKYMEIPSYTNALKIFIQQRLEQNRSEIVTNQ